MHSISFFQTSCFASVCLQEGILFCVAEVCVYCTCVFTGSEVLRSHFLQAWCIPVAYVNCFPRHKEDWLVGERSDHSTKSNFLIWERCHYCSFLKYVSSTKSTSSNIWRWSWLFSEVQCVQIETETAKFCETLMWWFWHYECNRP